MEEIKINEEKENLLFNRKEISFNLRREQTPSRAEVLDIVSEKFSTPKENIKIKNIGGRFGSKNFDVNVFVYDSEEDKNRVEIKKKKDAIPEEAKEEGKEEVKTEEVPKEEGKPIEESKEEVKTEEVKVEEKTNAAKADIDKTDNVETKSNNDSKDEVKKNDNDNKNVEENKELNVAPKEGVPSESEGKNSEPKG